MKFSESWLREWVNPNISTEALVEQITMAGLEVDGIDAVAGEFSGVVVGEVVECAQHPDADKLRVTKVNVASTDENDEAELLDIVCGAPNCRQGLKVAVATVGAVLPGDFKIKKAKLRAQPSHGMLCSFSELGLSDESDGIMELPTDAPVGTDLRDYLKLNDVTIEVDLTPNRADCLGIRGLAREVGVLNSVEVCEPDITPVPAAISDEFSIEIEAAEQCPRYLGRVIRGINPGAESPLWLKEKLRRCGVRSIDPVVDVTNYVLLELGHPMHAFDLAKLNGGIKVRMAEQGEKLTLLDGNEVALNSDTLVIADQQKAVAMAGIFGGLDTGVTAESSDIFLEAAFFSRLAIMGRARSYGLHTDASHRYERGVDPYLTHQAMERATQLLLDIVGGEAGPITEAVHQSQLPQNAQVTLTKTRLCKLIGIEIAAEKVSGILQRLGFEVQINAQNWQVEVPAYRFDISIEEDLIEEVARIYGYNNIPNVAPQASLKMSKHNESSLSLDLFKQSLIDNGYQEAITYSFVDPKVQQLLFKDQAQLTLPHPISSDMSVMRLSLLCGLLPTVVYNQNRQQTRVRIFETGLRFIPDESAENGVCQQAMIAGVISGTAFGEQWSMDKRPVDFYDIKGDVEKLLALTGESVAFRFVQKSHPALHPGQSAAIYRNQQLLGYVGALHPEVERKLGLNGKTFVFELLQDVLTKKQIPEAVSVSKFPANRRDIAVVVDEDVNAADILNCIQKVGGNQLVGLNLFDVYTGKGIDQGQKSLAIALTLQDAERTLEDSEIHRTVDAVVAQLKQDFNASLR